MSKALVLAVAALALSASVGSSQNCQGPANCLSFTSTDLDHVRIPDPGAAQLDGFGDFTIECWFKTASGGVDTLVSKWRQSTPGQTPYLLRLAPSRIQVFFTNGFSVTGTVIVNNNAWHHVAVTRTGSAGQIVVDGVLDTAFVYAPTLDATSGPLVFGCFLDVNDNIVGGTFLHGFLDEVRIWNVGRTIAQIQSTMNQAIQGFTPNLKGAWRLDSTSGQTVSDESMTAAHGFLGATNAVALNDPAFGIGAGPTLGYPCTMPGNGNANSALATLIVNGNGAAPITGPFAVNLLPGGTIVFAWSGPVGKPFVLIGGMVNVANAVVPGLGTFDIGIPPAYADLAVLFDGTQGTGSFLYSLGSGGTATQIFTLPPSLPAGPFLSIQGLVFQPAGTTTFGSILTAAFTLIG